MSDPAPRYLAELTDFVAQHLTDAELLVSAIAAILVDPNAYIVPKGEPSLTLVNFAQELALSDHALQHRLSDPDFPLSRELIDDKWSIVWRGARASERSSGPFHYDVCVSFAGADRQIAETIASALRSNGMHRRVFYDEFETASLWGEDLLQYLYDIYSRQCRFCLILFSHRYRQLAWTRLELKAAQTRTLSEREAYVLPVALARILHEGFDVGVGGDGEGWGQLRPLWVVGFAGFVV